MLKITLDSSCLENSKEFGDLIGLCEAGKLFIQISPITMEEISQTSPKRLKQFVECLHVVNKPILEETKEFDEIANRALLIHSPTTDRRVIQKMSDPEEFTKRILNRKNDFNDVDIFAFHILTKADVFVTKDEKGFIRNGKKERFEREFNTKVRYLDRKFIEELKSE